MVTITKENDTITFEGHTIPVVCSAISSIMYVSAKFLMKYDSTCIDYTDLAEETKCDIIKEDKVVIKILKHDNVIDTIIDNMYDCLKDLKEEDDECLDIRW